MRHISSVGAAEKVVAIGKHRRRERSGQGRDSRYAETAHAAPAGAIVHPALPAFGERRCAKAEPGSSAERPSPGLDKPRPRSNL